MKTVTIKSKLVNGAAIIYPGAYLNQLRGEVIEHQCKEFLGNGVKRLVINFEETELINSIGISILLEVMETIKAAKGTLLLSNLNDSNRELFEMLGLMSHVYVEETEQIALAKLYAYAS
ncbi:MAG: STAS domain-containing protein [Acidobacteriota bacterium]